MKSSYQDVGWLHLKWSGAELVEWSDSEISARRAIVQAAVDENTRRYYDAKRQLDAYRAAWRAEHRRNTALPSGLRKSVAQTPDLWLYWNRLMTRRRREINRRANEAQRQADQADQQRADFRDRMDRGKIEARKRRERAIRALIDAKAKACGITLTERATDARLGELLNQLERAAVVEIDDPPLGEMNLT